MSTNSSDTQQRNAKLVKWGLIGVGCVVAPFVAVFILKTIVALVVAAGLGLGALIFGPVIEMKMRNQQVKMVVAEAQENPIESLLNQLINKRQAASQFADRITEFRTEIKNFQDQVNGFTKQYPEDAPRFAAQLSTMNQLLHFREDRYKALQLELDNFAKAIDRAKALWEMSQAAQRMNKAAGKDSADTFEQIKTDAAVTSVMKSVNTAFSQMETALLDNPEVKKAQQAALTNDTTPSLNNLTPVMINAAPVEITRNTIDHSNTQ